MEINSTVGICYHRNRMVYNDWRGEQSLIMTLLSSSFLVSFDGHYSMEYTLAIL